MEPSIPFEKHHFEFLSDPERARAYLEVALEDYARDHDRSILLLALKDVASAQGGLGRPRSQVSKTAFSNQFSQQSARSKNQAIQLMSPP